MYLFLVEKHQTFSSLYNNCIIITIIITIIVTVLDKTLKGIRGVLLNNRKVFSAPGPKTKYFEHFF